MPVRGHHLTSRPRGRALRFIALLCILTMPLQFKGGAAEAHPHAFFQFWSDAEAAPHHHGDRNDRFEGDHAYDVHGNADRVVLDPSRAAADRAGDAPASSATVAPPGVIGAGQVAGLALAFFLALAILAPERHRGLPRGRQALNGREVTPPVPPPRATLERIIVPAH